MEPSDKKITIKDQITMNSKESCEAAIKYGWITAIISLSITFIFSILGFFIQSENIKLNQLLNPVLLINAVLISITAFFIYKKSRTASTLMFLYFIASKIIQFTEIQSATGLPLSIIFSLIFFNAMRGTFIWHSVYKNKKAAREHFNLEIEV